MIFSFIYDIYIKNNEKLMLFLAMSKNNKSLASQALLEMEDIKKAIKEESKNTLKTILSEAVKDALRESIDEEEEEKDYEVVDDENDAKTDNDEKDEEGKEEGNIEEDDDQDLQNADPNAQEAPVADPNAMGDEPVADSETGAEEAPEDNMDSDGEGEDEWSEFQQYQSGDNTYDLTGVNDPGTVLKAYKLLKDDDQVVVKKEGSMINIQDNETGNEYMIDLGDAEEGGEEAPEGEEEMSGINEGFDSDGDEFIFNDEEGDELEPVNYEEDYDEFEGEPEGELGPNGEEPAGFNGAEEEEFNNRFEGKKSRKTMKENKSKKNELLFEIDLGYTDNYQSKDPIQGLSNSEPSKSGKSWEKGVPTGTEKPWAGETKSKGDPFKKTQKVQGSVNEEDITDAPDSVEDMPVDEQMNVGGFVQDNTTATSRKPNNPTHRNARSERGSNFTPSTEAPYKGVNESLNKIKKENKILKEAVKELRKNLNEAYLTNVNLGKITKLFLENAVSQEEKVNIINRFVNEAKTVDQSKQLFESISKDLQKVTKASLTESRLTAEGSKKLNENTIYKSQDLQATLDFIKRMENL